MVGVLGKSNILPLMLETRPDAIVYATIPYSLTVPLFALTVST
jgi:hypothetical protein